jgi:hypothetical protein
MGYIGIAVQFEQLLELPNVLEGPTEALESGIDGIGKELCEHFLGEFRRCHKCDIVLLLAP